MKTPIRYLNCGFGGQPLLTLAKCDSCFKRLVVQDRKDRSGYRGAMRKAAELLEVRATDTYVPVFDIVRKYAEIRDRQKTLLWLEKALVERDPGLPYITVAPPLDFVRDEPRFKVILRTLNLWEE